MPDPLLELLSVPHNELPLHRWVDIPQIKKLTRFVYASLGSLLIHLDRNKSRIGYFS
jgi:hypothetical protein